MTDLFDKYKLSIVGPYLEESVFDNELELWINKFGNTPNSKRDFMWSMFNRTIISIGKNYIDPIQLYQNQREVYGKMLGFLIDEQKKITHISKLLNFCDLMIAAGDDYKQQVEFIANKCCPECDKIDGTIINLEEAIEKKPLPNPLCTRKMGCFCKYGFIGLRDENGRLIMK